MAAVLALVLVLVPVAGRPVVAAGPRALQPFTLDMVEGGGVLQLRDAEPYAIQSPTTISGSLDVTDDAGPGTGALAGGTFTTPPVSIEQDITSPVEATVFIDATFSQVEPGNLTGSVDSEGNVTIQVALAVELDIEVGRPAILSATCQASPIALTLTSVAPYEGGSVTVHTPNFSVPPVVQTPACSSTIAGPVDDQLAGSGHALSLTLAGELELPPSPGATTATTLAVAPAGESRLGQEVTLAAKVVDEGGSGEVPEGVVEFRDGQGVLGTADLVDGEAELVTSDLPVGARLLRARYLGEPGVFAPSTSQGVGHVVAATVQLQADLPERLRLGRAVELDMVVRNPGLGQDLGNARVDITIQRAVGTGAVDPARMVVERSIGGGPWEAIDLTRGPSGTVVVGMLGPAEGAPLVAGADRPERLRFQFAPDGEATMSPGPILVTFEVVEVDPTTGLPAPVAATRPTFGVGGVGQSPGSVAWSVGRVTLIESERRPSTVTAGIVGFPPIIPSYPPVTPHTVRQGGTVHLESIAIGPAIAGVPPTGLVEVYLDQVRLPIRRWTQPIGDGYLDQVPLPLSGVLTAHAAISAAHPVGVRTLTVRYLGDDLFLPSDYTTSLTVVPSVGRPAYDCSSNGPGRGRFRAAVVAEGHVPLLARAGATVELDGLAITLVTDRGPAASALSHLGSGTVLVGSDRLDGVELGFGPQGAGSAVGIEREGGGWQFEVDDTDPDHTVVLSEPTGTVTVASLPGQSVAATLDSIVLLTDSGVGGIKDVITCTAVDDPVVLGSVTAVGVDLSASPAVSLQQGRPMTLTAEVRPALSGHVEFWAGGQAVGFAPVIGGRAAVEVVPPVGTTTFTARFYGGVQIPVVDAEPLVLPAIDCAPSAQPGNAAVVRLVYLELLGRCPDVAGFAFWTGQLDGGTPVETFARSIARTPEAVGVVVDDAYRTMLGRGADAAGRTFWVERMGAGSGRYDRLLAQLAGTGEFWSLAGGTHAGIVTRVYEQLLGRAPEPAGLAYWTGRLAAGTSPGVLVRTLANLDEPLGVLVGGSYQQLLARTPGATERSAGIAFLRATGDRSSLHAQLMGTTEFTQRAQSFPNTGD